MPTVSDDGVTETASEASSSPRSLDSSGSIAHAGQFYRPELDWLRFMAFFLVFMLHAFPHNPDKYIMLGVPRVLAYAVVPLVKAGGFGVDLFFALSSFLITELLLREKEATGRVHVKAFYLRRVLRIWPLYITFILAVGPYEVLAKKVPLAYYISLLAFVNNWYIVVFGGLRSFCGNLWSISVEEQFYLVWPNLVGRVRTDRFVATLIGLFVFTCCYRVLYAYGALGPQFAVWYNTLTRLDGFALGALLACVLHKRTIVVPLVGRLAAVAVALGILWTIGHHYPFGGYYGGAVLTYPLVGMGSVLLIFAFVASPNRTSLGRPLQVLSYLGKISYGLYVFHGPALQLAEPALRRVWSSGEWLWVCRMVLAACLTLVVSMLSYSVLEKPFLRMKRRFTFVQSRPAEGV